MQQNRASFKRTRADSGEIQTLVIALKLLITHQCTGSGSKQSCSDFKEGFLHAVQAEAAVSLATSGTLQSFTVKMQETVGIISNYSKSKLSLFTL